MEDGYEEVISNHIEGDNEYCDDDVNAYSGSIKRQIPIAKKPAEVIRPRL